MTYIRIKIELLDKNYDKIKENTALQTHNLVRNNNTNSFVSENVFVNLFTN